MKVPVSMTVNGVERTGEVEPRLLLVHYLREVLGLTGTNIGCDTSQCGACTVLLDGMAVKSCTVLACQADGSQITTIEGLAQNGNLHPLQEAFWEKHGLQCGYCTPGMIMNAVAFLRKNRHPSTAQIIAAMDDNLCRCGSHNRIVQALQTAAKRLKEGRRA